MPERMGVYPKASPLGERGNHRLDPRSLVRRSVLVNEQLTQLGLRPQPSLVPLDPRRQLGRDGHPARLTALGAGVPTDAELDPPAAQGVGHDVGQSVRSYNRQATELLAA